MIKTDQTGGMMKGFFIITADRYFVKRVPLCFPQPIVGEK